LLPIRTSLKNLASFVNFSKNLEPILEVKKFVTLSTSKIMLEMKNVGPKHTQYLDPIEVELENIGTKLLSI
jgi:predicted thioredoxin/glutaredoxin